MISLENAGFATFAVAMILRLLFGSFVRRGSKWDDEPNLHQPFAARWLGPKAVSGGAALGAASLLLAGGLLIASYLGIDAA